MININNYYHTPTRQLSQNEQRFKVLCVDDNMAILKAYKYRLQTYGFEVIVACHGVDALMQFHAQKSDIQAIVTDNEMPEMCGLEFVRSIRESGFEGKILVASGSLHPEVQEAYEAYDVIGFIHKPFDLTELAARLLQDN